MTNTLLNLTSQALQIPKTEIKHIRPAGGMTNINYEVTIQNEQYIVRLPGLGTEQFINRHEEEKNLRLGTSLGINPEEIFFNAKTGLKITRLIPGARTLTIETTKKEEIMKAVAYVFRTLHQSKLQMENDFKLVSLMDEYEEIALREGAQFYPRFKVTKEDVLSILFDYKQFAFETKPTHIDALYQNFIQDEHDKLYLIDWEYSGMFDALWDISTHMMESRFNVDEEEAFLELYFQREVTAEEEQRIMMHKIFQDYLWSLWTLFKEAKGNEFGSYGIDRYMRLEENIAFYKERYRQEISV